MSQVYEELLKSLGIQIEPEENLAKEAHRLYLSAKVEAYEGRIEAFKQAVYGSIEENAHKNSPFMFGLIEGMMRTLAFISGTKVKRLEKPLAWFNDTETERRIRMTHSYRQNVRRKVTREIWKMLCTHHNFNRKPGKLSQECMERYVRAYVKEVLSAIPPSYMLRMKRKQLIKWTGANYEEVRNAKIIESWWA